MSLLIGNKLLEIIHYPPDCYKLKMKKKMSSLLNAMELFVRPPMV